MESDEKVPIDELISCDNGIHSQLNFLKQDDIENRQCSEDISNDTNSTMSKTTIQALTSKGSEDQSNGLSKDLLKNFKETEFIDSSPAETTSARFNSLAQTICSHNRLTELNVINKKSDKLISEENNSSCQGNVQNSDKNKILFKINCELSKKSLECPQIAQNTTKSIEGNTEMCFKDIKKNQRTHDGTITAPKNGEKTSKITSSLDKTSVSILKCTAKQDQEILEAIGKYCEAKLGSQNSMTIKASENSKTGCHDSTPTNGNKKSITNKVNEQSRTTGKGSKTIATVQEFTAKKTSKSLKIPEKDGRTIAINIPKLIIEKAQVSSNKLVNINEGSQNFTTKRASPSSKKSIQISTTKTSSQSVKISAKEGTTGETTSVHREKPCPKNIMVNKKVVTRVHPKVDICPPTSSATHPSMAQKNNKLGKLPLPGSGFWLEKENQLRTLDTERNLPTKAIPGLSYISTQKKGNCIRYSCMACDVLFLSGPCMMKHITHTSHLLRILELKNIFMFKEISQSKDILKWDLFTQVKAQLYLDEAEKKIILDTLDDSLSIRQTILANHRAALGYKPDENTRNFAKIVILVEESYYDMFRPFETPTVRVLTIPKLQDASDIIKSQQSCDQSRCLWLLFFGISCIGQRVSCFYCQLEKCSKPVHKLEPKATGSPQDIRSLRTHLQDLIAEVTNNVDSVLLEGSKLCIMPPLPSSIVSETKYTHGEMHRKKIKAFVVNPKDITNLTSTYNAVCQSVNRYTNRPSSDRLQPLHKFCVSLQNEYNFVQNITSMEQECTVSSFYYKGIQELICESLKFAHTSPKLKTNVKRFCLNELYGDEYDHFVFLAQDIVLESISKDVDCSKSSKIPLSDITLSNYKRKLLEVIEGYDNPLVILIPDVSMLIATQNCSYCLSNVCPNPILYVLKLLERLPEDGFERVMSLYKLMCDFVGPRGHVLVTHFFPRVAIKIFVPVNSTEHSQVHDIAAIHSRPIFIYPGCERKDIIRLNKYTNRMMLSTWTSLYPDLQDVALIHAYKCVKLIEVRDVSEDVSVRHWLNVLQLVVQQISKNKTSPPNPTQFQTPQQSVKRKNAPQNTITIKKPKMDFLHPKTGDSKRVSQGSSSKPASCPDLQAVLDHSEGEPVVTGNTAVVKLTNVSGLVKKVHMFRIIAELCATAHIRVINQDSYIVTLPQEHANTVYLALNKYRLIDRFCVAELIITNGVPNFLSRKQQQRFQTIMSFIYKANKSTFVEDMKKRNHESRQYLDLSTYKTEACPVTDCCAVFCEHFHSIYDSRRDPYKTTYRPELCDISQCTDGVTCFQAHNTFEIKFHPTMYKNQLCADPNCHKLSYCPFSHAGTIDTVFTSSWQNLFVIDLVNTFHCLYTVLSLIHKSPQRIEMTILVISTSEDYLQLLKEASTQILQQFRYDSGKVIYGTPKQLIRNFGSLATVLSRVTVIIIDGVDIMLEQRCDAQKLFVLLKEMKKIMNYSWIHKIAVVTKSEPDILTMTSRFLDCHLTEWNPSSDIDPTSAIISKTDVSTTSIKPDYNKSSQDLTPVALDIQPPSQASSPSVQIENLSCNDVNPVPGTSLKRKLCDNQEYHLTKVLTQGNPVDTWGEPARRSTVTSNETSHADTHPTNIELELPSVQPHKLVNQSTLSDDNVKPIAESFLEEKAKARRDHEEEYGVYKEVPDIHPEFEQQYEMFIVDYNKHHRGEADKEDTWDQFWKDFIVTRSNSHWTKKLNSIRAKYLPKSSQLLEDLMISNQKYSISATLDILDKLKGNFGPFRSAVNQVITVARKERPNASAMFKVISDKDAVGVLKIVIGKMKQLKSSATTSVEQELYERAINFTTRMVEEGKEASPAVDVENIAQATLGKDVKFTLDVIQTALAYEGYPEPSPELVNKVYMAVCSWHLRLSVAKLSGDKS